MCYRAFLVAASAIAVMCPAILLAENSTPLLKSLDCSTLVKQSDGSWIVIKPTTIIDAEGNLWTFNTGKNIGPGLVVVAPSKSLSNLIDQQCAH